MHSPRLSETHPERPGVAPGRPNTPEPFHVPVQTKSQEASTRGSRQGPQAQKPSSWRAVGGSSA
eukprot:2374766-Alexandrium_andersonii.AAC.1